MAIKVNKLQITLHTNLPGTIGVGRVVTFNVTEITQGVTTAADDFGRFLQDRIALPAGAPAGIRAANRVFAWFQAGQAVEPQTFGGGVINLDFVAATGVATTLASLNPVLTRLFRLRAVIMRTLTAAEFPATTIDGVIQVEQEHSIEV